MKTNLIFKRTVTINNVPRTVTRIVSVEVPSVNSGEGWILAGSADVVEVLESTPNLCILPDLSPVLVTPQVSELDSTQDHVDVEKFISDVSGTARLVRNKGVIKIVARKGKTVRNQTSPNSVCISDEDKTRFFKHCRELFGYDTTTFQFSSKNKFYDFWNAFIDTEYQKQKTRYIAKKSKEK